VKSLYSLTPQKNKKIEKEKFCCDQEFAFRTKGRDLQAAIQEFDTLINEEKQLEEKLAALEGTVTSSASGSFSTGSAATRGDRCMHRMQDVTGRIAINH
jgi:hypothetical protein